MRVVCDNCGATYKIPESKLTKEVNKATCRKCGHRMLIRRAVSAPPPAPPPPSSDGEHTQIRRPPPAAANEWADDGPTRIARAPEDENDRPTVAMDTPPPVAPPAPPAPATPVLPRPVTPQAAPIVPAAPPRPAPQPAPAPATAAPVAPAPQPAPQPVAPQAAAAPAFDPSGDLTWAALGSLVAVAGALALAFNITSSATLRTVGLALVLSGALLSLFVLLTGGRGLRKANLGVSIAFAAILGIGVSTVIHNIFTNLYGMNESIEMAASRGAPPPPIEADPADDDVLAALAEPGGLAEVEEVEADTDTDTDVEEPAAVVAAAAPPPQRRETRAAAAPIRGSGTDVAPARSEPRRDPAPARVAPAAAPEPPPEPAPKKQMTRLPTSVVETMIRNNKRIKRCWMEEKQRSGELPKRVDVKFTVQPSGQVSSARSATKKYRGTDFEVCLGSAFRSITFPPFDGDPLSMTYNFAL